MLFRNEKSKNDIYQKYINKFDVIFLSEISNSETYMNKSQHAVCYFHVNICRKRKNRKVQTSGTMLVYYWNEWSNFLSAFNKSHENINWRKLNMELIRKSRNIYVAGVYNSPKNTS